MRLFRKKKKETPRKAKPASIYYSPAAASTPTALRNEEAVVPQTPQERALADFAAATPVQTPPTLRTPVQIPSSRNGDLDGADLRDTLARADIDPEAMAASAPEASSSEPLSLAPLHSKRNSGRRI